MLKKAVKLLRGSVCVRAKSAYPERMLNLFKKQECLT